MMLALLVHIMDSSPCYVTFADCDVCRSRGFRCFVALAGNDPGFELVVFISFFKRIPENLEVLNLLKHNVILDVAFIHTSRNVTFFATSGRFAPP